MREAGRQPNISFQEAAEINLLLTAPALAPCTSAHSLLHLLITLKHTLPLPLSHHSYFPAGLLKLLRKETIFTFILINIILLLQLNPAWTSSNCLFFTSSWLFAVFFVCLPDSVRVKTAAVRVHILRSKFIAAAKWLAPSVTSRNVLKTYRQFLSVCFICHPVPWLWVKVLPQSCVLHAGRANVGDVPPLRRRTVTWGESIMTAVTFITD